MPKQERQTSSQLLVRDPRYSADTAGNRIPDQKIDSTDKEAEQGIVFASKVLAAANNEGTVGGSNYASQTQECPKVENIDIERIHPNPRQPRKRMDEEALAALAGSLAEEGFLQPILVRPHPSIEGQYEIVAGERRWRAAKLAGFRQVPALIREMSHGSSLEAALVENMQRQDLNPIEVAEGYKSLMEEFGHSYESIAQLFGKSRSHVVNTKRLLNLPSTVRELVENGALTAGHARALLNAEQPEDLAKHVVAKGLSVRRTEQLAQPVQVGDSIQTNAESTDATKVMNEPNLTALLGLRVTISHRSGGSVLNIHCDDPTDLNDLIERLRDCLHGTTDSKPVENGDGDPIDGVSPAQDKLKLTKPPTREELKKLAEQHGYSYP